MPLPRYSVHVVPMPLRTTSAPLRRSLLFPVDQMAGGDGGGRGGAGGGGRGAAPHHLALCPPLHMPRHPSSFMQPGLVLQTPQSQLASHEYPQAGPTMVPLFVLHVPGYPGVGAGGGGTGGVGTGGVGGAGGVGLGLPHHFALCPPSQFVMQVVSDIQPGLMLHRPQLQAASQA